jgi:serine/threonine kinase 16
VSPKCNATTPIPQVKDRRTALLLEEEATSKCSPAYRAPELTAVELGKPIDSRVDVWALGCMLYCMAFGRNPFESPTEGVLKLAILNGRFSFPADTTAPTGDQRFSPAFCALVQTCLQPDPSRRPFLAEVVKQTRGLIGR